MANADPNLHSWRKQKRSELLGARAALSPAEHAECSREVLNRLGSHLTSPRGTIGFYWPFRGEISVLPFIERLLAAGVDVALPVVVVPGQPLEFHAWSPGEPLLEGVYGIPYPAQRKLVAPDTLLIPLVGFDPDCFRLGYGGGYYDRTLRAAQRKPLTIGIGFELSCLSSIHPQPHDVPLDSIVTEQAVRKRSPA